MELLGVSFKSGFMSQPGLLGVLSEDVYVG